MFEIIGLMLGTVLLLVVSTIVGLFYAAVAFAILKQRPNQRKRWLFVAAIIPVVSAAYLWCCVAMLPGETLFGDISQPLPNGYSLQALGKMPDFASIVKGTKLSDRSVRLTEFIGSVSVQGSLVVGQHSHPENSFYSHADEKYFIFDTRNETFNDYPSLQAFTTSLGHSVKLVSTDQFRSQEPSYLKLQANNRRIMFLPPLFASLTFLAYLLFLRNAAKAHRENYRR